MLPDEPKFEYVIAKPPEKNPWEFYGPLHYWNKIRYGTLFDARAEQDNAIRMDTVGGKPPPKYAIYKVTLEKIDG